MGGGMMRTPRRCPPARKSGDLGKPGRFEHGRPGVNQRREMGVHADGVEGVERELQGSGGLVG